MSRALAEFLRILPEPCYLVTPSGEIRAANGAAARLSGTSIEALLGGSFPALVHAPPDKVRQYLAACARSRQLVPGGFVWNTPRDPLEVRCDGAVVEPSTPGSEAVIFVRCRPKAEATDQFVLLNQKIQSLSKEILERKKAELERDELLVSERTARLEAERNSRLKDEFLAVLSHELRTPLNAIVGWTSLLSRDDSVTAPATRQAIAVIERNAHAQSRLIQDLLDISQIISGKVRLDVQRVELAAIIEAAIEAVKPAAESRGIRLQVTLDPLAAPVKGDPSRLQQIVWNLLTNAIKFTPRDGRVQVLLERVNSHLEITVSDNGQGIRPEFLPHVFDRFRQQDASASRHAGGLGLGLAIVKELTELHGGTVRAKSPGPGQGSSFLVCLPLPPVHASPEEEMERAHPQTNPVAPQPRVNTPLDGLRVLVVDDDPDGRDLVRELLESRGAAVSTAGSAVEALAALDPPPDLLVSDIGMPGADGYDFIRRVRRLPPAQGGRIPAIALTAFARSGDRTSALLAGFQLHLSKPIEVDELVAAIASLTGRFDA